MTFSITDNRAKKAIVDRGILMFGDTDATTTDNKPDPTDNWIVEFTLDQDKILSWVAFGAMAGYFQLAAIPRHLSDHPACTIAIDAPRRAQGMFKAEAGRTYRITSVGCAGLRGELR